jgi:Uma2 family endonuclease
MEGAWIPKQRWERLSGTEMDSLAPICPDFVIELRSSSDRRKVLEAKMEEYMANGARLGWLLDPFANQAVIYRSGEPPEGIEKPATIDAEPVLPGFRFDFGELL